MDLYHADGLLLAAKIVEARNALEVVLNDKEFERYKTLLSEIGEEMNSHYNEVFKLLSFISADRYEIILSQALQNQSEY